MLLNKLMPSLQLNSIYDLDTAMLKKMGIRGLIADLDNTLIDWNSPSATPELVKWIQQLRTDDFRIIVVSNNNEERVRFFAEPHQIDYISAARKPSKKAFLTSLERMQLTASETAVIGDQLFTDILGGNRLGFYTILVLPTATTDKWMTRINRFLERIVIQSLRKKGLKR